MRRALAAAILGISLWLGSLAWTGFILTRTVLDPDRSRQVAEDLYEDEAVRDQLVENIADGVEAALPPGTVPRATVEAGARQTLESPAVEALFVDAFVQTHAALLGEGEAPEALDAGAFGSAARESLVAAHPELAPFLPEAPQLAIPLPTERVPDLGPVRDVVVAAVPVLALLSAAGALLALLVTSNRPAVVRRAGVWAMGLAAVVLAFAYGVPALVRELAPDQAEVVAALVGAMAASTRVPALVLGATGLAGVVLSAVWRAAPARSPSPPPPPVTSPPRRRRAAGGSPPLPPRRQRQDLERPPRGAPRPRSPRSAPAPAAGGRSGPVEAPTRVQPAPPRQPPTASPRPSAGTPDVTRIELPGRRWVDGVGWVVDTSVGEIPADARWVPGVGYVVGEP
ncbi:MAG TPA: hypothetical protein VFU14_14420 [Acidimicrobiales bacterium]|nr:hypothetical protein [Acidimicrobiales bacterium]